MEESLAWLGIYKRARSLTAIRQTWLFQFCLFCEIYYQVQFQEISFHLLNLVLSYSQIVFWCPFTFLGFLNVS